MLEHGYMYLYIYMYVKINNAPQRSLFLAFILFSIAGVTVYSKLAHHARQQYLEAHVAGGCSRRPLRGEWALNRRVCADIRVRPIMPAKVLA